VVLIMKNDQIIIEEGASVGWDDTAMFGVVRGAPRQRGQLLSRLGCSSPASASGLDPHRASMGHHFDLR
jgi:hypothetical protein